MKNENDVAVTRVKGTALQAPMTLSVTTAAYID